MGRKRKKLIEKSSPIMFRIDNETLFKLCDRLDIEYDDTAEILDKTTKDALNVEIKKIVYNFVK